MISNEISPQVKIFYKVRQKCQFVIISCFENLYIIIGENLISEIRFSCSEYNIQSRIFAKQMSPVVLFSDASRIRISENIKVQQKQKRENGLNSLFRMRKHFDVKTELVA